MKRLRICFFLIPIFVLSIFLSSSTLSSAEKAASSKAPHDNNGRKWRIAYCEPYNYTGYADALYYILQELQAMGWITNAEKVPYQAGTDNTTVMWQYLTKTDMGKYIEFPEDAYYTYNRSNDEDNAITNRIIGRMNDRKDVDLFIVMGTKSAQKVANTAHKVPTLVFSTSNAVQSGIIKSAEDPGYDNVWAHMDPNRYRRQVEVFHDIMRFKKLGLVYEDTQAGRTFAAVDDVEALAKERGFQIVRRFVNSPSTSDKTDFYKNLLQAHKELANEVDAFYLTTNSAREPKKLPELLRPFHDKKIPVFSQDGGDELKFGALMSLAKADLRGVGHFGAETVIGVLNGNSPRKLTQIYENTPTIALNLEVAEMIGYKPPFDILLVADQIYQHIEKGE